MAGGAAERDRVCVCWHDVGHSVYADALIQSLRTLWLVVKRSPHVRDLVGDVLNRRSLGEKHRPDAPGMVGLDCQNARRGLEKSFVGNKGGRALVGSDPDILEHERSENKVDLIGERIEGIHSESKSQRVEAFAEIDLRPRYLRAAENLTEKTSVVRLIDGNFVRVVFECRRLEVHLRVRLDGHLPFLPNPVSTDTGGLKALAGHAVEVILGLKILEVEREIEDRQVQIQAARRRCGWSNRARRPRAALLRLGGGRKGGKARSPACSHKAEAFEKFAAASGCRLFIGGGGIV